MKSTTREIACLLLLAPLTSLADTNDIKLGLSADVAQSDNAKKKQSRLENNITERQEKYIANLVANYTNQWTDFKTNYSVREEVYEEDTQPNFNMLEGKTEWNFGNEHQPVSVLLTQSSMSLLNSPDAAPLSKNLVQRNIYGVEPMVKLRMSSADLLVFKASAQEVTFGRNHDSDVTQISGQNKAKQTGGEIDWVRGLSSVDTLQFVVQKQKTTFENHAESDYGYENITGVYSVKLNHLSYSLGIGQNRATKDIDNSSYTEPSYNLASSYAAGSNVFKLSAKQTITDSSKGNGNGESLGDTSHASADTGSDLINLRDEELSWTTTAICELCDFTLSAVQHTKDYRNLREDNKEKNIGGNFRYKLTRASAIGLRVSHDIKTFEKKPVNPAIPDPRPQYTDYTSNHINITYEYTFANDVKMDIYADQEKRSSADFEKNYDENRAGIRLSYSF